MKAGFLPETERETIKDSAMRCMWLIRENDLLHARTDQKLNRRPFYNHLRFARAKQCKHGDNESSVVENPIALLINKF